MNEYWIDRDIEMVYSSRKSIEIIQNCRKRFDHSNSNKIINSFDLIIIDTDEMS